MSEDKKTNKLNTKRGKLRVASSKAAKGKDLAVKSGKKKMKKTNLGKPKLQKKTKGEVKDKKKVAVYYAVGRRRTAVARVRLYEGKDEVMVNGVLISSYFPGDYMKSFYNEPFRTTNTLNKYTATIKVKGSGKMGQLGAVVHGVSRALAKLDSDKFKRIVRAKGFLTRDPRMKERRKPGLAQSARARKQSPKR